MGFFDPLQKWKQHIGEGGGGMANGSGSQQQRMGHQGMGGFGGSMGGANYFGPNASYGRYDQPGNYFGIPQGLGERLKGSGARGLPTTFSGWQAPARYSFFPGLNFLQGSQPALQYFQQGMQKPWEQTFYGLNRQATEAQLGDSRLAQGQANQRAGITGGSTTSPMVQQQLQLEGMARSGALGQGAMLAVLQAEQLKSQFAQQRQGILQQIYQAMIAPAQFQTARAANLPVGNVGPSGGGYAAAGLGGLLGAAA